MKINCNLVVGNLSVDDRGVVSFVNDFDFLGVKRFYTVSNHRNGFIRAWHGHKKEGKYVYVVTGSALIGVVNMDSEKVEKYILSDRQPKILWIPPNHFNGFKTLEENTKLIFFSTSDINESHNDDIREEYNKWDIWNENYR